MSDIGRNVPLAVRKHSLCANASRMYLSRKMVSLMPSLAHSSGHVGTRMDTSWDIKRDIIYISLMSIGQMVHKRTQTDSILVSVRVPSRPSNDSGLQKASRDGFQRQSG
jgi:hypothetical protein